MHNYFYYSEINKKYFLYDAVDILLATMSKVALVFAVDITGEVKLVRYGDFTFVQAWFERERQKPWRPGESFVMFIGKFDVDKLNKLISDDKYAKTFHDELLTKSEEWKWSKENRA